MHPVFEVPPDSGGRDRVSQEQVVELLHVVNSMREVFIPDHVKHMSRGKFPLKAGASCFPGVYGDDIVGGFRGTWIPKGMG